MTKNFVADTERFAEEDRVPLIPRPTTTASRRSGCALPCSSCAREYPCSLG